MINHLDRVLEVVLDQQTLLGALQKRLESTAGTVQTSTDNTRAAESVIRDADMAKEAMELNKSQVLEQAAQSMLAQANNNMEQGLRTITSDGQQTIEQAADVSSTKGAMDENLSAVGKDLQKVATGQKLNSVADDASAYSISENMQVQIRALEQDVQNVQNGHCMLNIAEKAIDEQIQIVKRLNSIGLMASDAACAQEDRDVLQKEVSELADQLEQIAWNTTYNGKRLLCGTEGKKQIERRYSNFDPAGEVQYNKIGGLFPPSPLNWSNAHRSPGYQGYRSEDQTVPLNFSEYGRNKHGGPLSVSDLDMQGMSLLCAGCPQFVSILFDASKDPEESIYHSRRKTPHFNAGDVRRNS